jgi:peptide deformylase
MGSPKIDAEGNSGGVELFQHLGNGKVEGAGTVRTILRFPDSRLRANAELVTEFDEALRSLAADLLDIMRAAPGIGITAPHIGVLKRLVVIELAAADGVRTYVNPQIVWTSAGRIRHEEGSVSMPGVTEEIERHARVRIRYQDLSGVELIKEADGLLSICLQHEIDQLGGIFWIDRLSRLKRDRIVKRFEKMHRAKASSD